MGMGDGCPLAHLHRGAGLPALVAMPMARGSGQLIELAEEA